MRHVILGFLVDEPLHGYELKRRLSPALSRRQQVNDGVLYPLLKRLQAEGLVERRIEPQQRNPARHVYHITERGRATFFHWLCGEAEEEDEVTYDFLLAHPFLHKCMFFHHLQRPQVIDKLRGQREKALAKLREFERIRQGMVQRGVDPYRVVILDLGLAQQEEKVAWLERMAQRLEKGQPIIEERKEENGEGS